PAGPLSACPWRVPLLLRRLYTRGSEPSGRRAKRRSRHDRHFFDERIRDGFSGLLSTAGTAGTRWCRHAATAHARSCQAEIAADTPLPPTASSKSKAVSTIRRCATLGSNFWYTARVRSARNN